MAQSAEKHFSVNVNYAWDENGKKLVLLFNQQVTNFQLTPAQAAQAIGFMLEIIATKGGADGAAAIKGFTWPKPVIPGLGLQQSS